MRMFVAIPVPDSVKKHAQGVRNLLASSQVDVKWVEYQNYHLTLKFLGEVKSSELPAVKRDLALAAASAPAFNLSAGSLGYFPNQNRPRVIWMGIKGELAKAGFLAERVDAYLATNGFEEAREHRFHLTLGRVRSDKNIQFMQKSAENMEGRNKLTTFKVDSFNLMMSDLQPGGPVYSVLDTFYLEG